MTERMRLSDLCALSWWFDDFLYAGCSFFKKKNKNMGVGHMECFSTRRCSMAWLGRLTIILHIVISSAKWPISWLNLVSANHWLLKCSHHRTALIMSQVRKKTEQESLLGFALKFLEVGGFTYVLASSVSSSNVYIRNQKRGERGEQRVPQCSSCLSFIVY